MLLYLGGSSRVWGAGLEDVLTRSSRPSEIPFVSLFTSCASCVAGQFKADVNTAACLRCESLRVEIDYSPLYTVASCEACAPGTYSSTAGLSFCSRCPEGMRRSLPPNSTLMHISIQLRMLLPSP